MLADLCTARKSGVCVCGGGLPSPRPYLRCYVPYQTQRNAKTHVLVLCNPITPEINT